MKKPISAAVAPALVAFGITLFAFGAAAQTPPAHLRGTIVSVSGDTIAVKTRAGQTVSVKLAPDLSVSGVFHAQIADIKSGSFIGTAAAPQPDGSLKALEVTVFPPGVTGGDGSYGWDLTPTSTMTNGRVGDVVMSNGRTITVKYPNGQKQIVVPDDVPVVSFHPSSKAALVVGAHVTVNETKAADGSISTSRIQVGENGVIPPA